MSGFFTTFSVGIIFPVGHFLVVLSWNGKDIYFDPVADFVPVIRKQSLYVLFEQRFGMTIT